MVVKVVLYSHDSMGLGHIRRNLALAHALSDGIEGVTGLLVAGRPEATRFAAPDGWDWLILPGVEPAPQGYTVRSLNSDLSTVTAMRGEIFRVAMRTFAPDLIVIDRHPLGVNRELEGALRRLRTEHPACRIVLGLRDVLDSPEVAAAEWRALGGGHALRAYLDAVWVYGDPRIHDLTASEELPTSLRDLVTHTGYLAEGRVAGHAHDITGPFVLTTVGGGADGTALATAAAAAPVPAGHRHLIVTGPQMAAADRHRVEELAGPTTQVVRRVPDALPLLSRASAVICMAGYNTICEVMSTDTPALVAPRSQRRAEQRLRAHALARTGAIETILPWEANPERIGAWLTENVGRRIARRGIELDGLTRVPRLASELLDSRHALPSQGGERIAV